MRRRYVLAGSVALLCAPFLGITFMRSRAIGRLRALLHSSAGEIGVIYLTSNPNEAESGILIALVLSSLSLDEMTLVTLDDGSLRTHISHQLCADFHDGRIVDVDGWILSQTEARLYALHAV